MGAKLIRLVERDEELKFNLHFEDLLSAFFFLLLLQFTQFKYNPMMPYLLYFVIIVYILFLSRSR